MARLSAVVGESAEVSWAIGAIIAATSQDLEAALRSGRFRTELYHRLAVFTVRLPALRERGADILLLAEHFLATTCADITWTPGRSSLP